MLLLAFRLLSRKATPGLALSSNLLHFSLYYYINEVFIYIYLMSIDGGDARKKTLEDVQSRNASYYLGEVPRVSRWDLKVACTLATMRNRLWTGHP